MIDYSKLKTALLNRVGFRPTFNSGTTPPISDDLVTSESGLLVNSLNEQFLTNDNIYASVRFFDGMELEIFVLINTYNKGDIVRITANGLKDVYVCRVDGTTNLEPSSNPDEWDTSLSFQLREYKETAINEVINDALTNKELKHSTKRLLANSPLFNARTVSKRTTKGDRFIGVEIIPAQRNNIQLQISKIGLRFAEGATVKFYLYHSSQNEALQTFDIIITNPLAFEWSEDLNIVLTLIDDDYNVGGRFYLGYYETELETDPFDWLFPRYWANTNYRPCSSCGGSLSTDFRLYKSARQFFAIRPITFSSDKLNGTNIPTLGEYFDNVTYSDRIPFNMRMSTYCDPTNALVETITMFDKALQAKIATIILFDSLNSNRVSSTGDNNARKIDLVLNGAFSNGVLVQRGVNHIYRDYIEQIAIDYSDLDPLCWRNNNRLTLGPN